jgi:hypothetical protein
MAPSPRELSAKQTEGVDAKSRRRYSIVQLYDDTTNNRHAVADVAVVLCKVKGVERMSIFRARNLLRDGCVFCGAIG